MQRRCSGSRCTASLVGALLPNAGKDQQSCFPAKAQVAVHSGATHVHFALIVMLLAYNACLGWLHWQGPPPLYCIVAGSIVRLVRSAVFDANHHCREAVFDAVIDEVLRPSEKMPLRHLGINQFADHLFQLGKPLQAYCSLTSKTISLFKQATVSILGCHPIDQWS